MFFSQPLWQSLNENWEGRKSKKNPEKGKLYPRISLIMTSLKAKNLHSLGNSVFRHWANHHSPPEKDKSIFSLWFLVFKTWRLSLALASLHVNVLNQFHLIPGIRRGQMGIKIAVNPGIWRFFCAPELNYMLPATMLTKFVAGLCYLIIFAWWSQMNKRKVDEQSHVHSSFMNKEAWNLTRCWSYLDYFGLPL